MRYAFTSAIAAATAAGRLPSSLTGAGAVTGVETGGGGDCVGGAGAGGASSAGAASAGGGPASTPFPSVAGTGSPFSRASKICLHSSGMLAGLSSKSSRSWAT